MLNKLKSQKKIVIINYHPYGEDKQLIFSEIQAIFASLKNLEFNLHLFISNPMPMHQLNTNNTQRKRESHKKTWMTIKAYG